MRIKHTWILPAAYIFLVIVGYVMSFTGVFSWFGMTFIEFASFPWSFLTPRAEAVHLMCIWQWALIGLLVDFLKSKKG